MLAAMLCSRSSVALFAAFAALTAAPLAAQDTAAAPPPGGDLVDFTATPLETLPSAVPAPPPAAPPASTAPQATARPGSPAGPALITPPVPAPHAARWNALNFSVLGFVIGNLRLTYERLLRPKHGLYADAIVAPDVLHGFDFVGYGGSMGYRFHWRGPATGGFVGAGVTLLRRSGQISVYDIDDQDTYRYRGGLFSVGVGPHVGKRWLWERTGINLTIRFGAGLLVSKAFPKRDVPKKATDGLTRFPVGAEGELSVGYTF
jgi:hypothetical protein